MLTATEGVLLAHAGATWMLFGLIWFVQVVHYPLMARVPAEAFVEYHHRHVRGAALVAGPLMLAELATGVILTLRLPFGVPPAAPWLGLALITLAWLSTGALQIPAHLRLDQGFDPRVHARLVAGNWVRTAVWTARAGLTIGMLAASRA